MTSAFVLLCASILHCGLRSSCFLSIESFPLIPGTSFAAHFAYCGLLYFLYDAELLPRRYQRRMTRLGSFLFQLVLGIAVMEVFGLWMWCNVEHVCHMAVKYALQHVGVSLQFYQAWEWAIMGAVMTPLSLLLWLNAFVATDPQAKQRERLARRAKISNSARHKTKCNQRANKSTQCP